MINQKQLIDISLQKIYRIAYQARQIYNFIFRPAAKGVYVAVWAENKILIIRNSYKNEFTMPCGGIKKTEQPIDAAIRELSEEVSITLNKTDLKFYCTYVNTSEYMSDYINLYEVYFAEQQLFEIDNREVVSAFFLTPKEALHLPLFPVVRQYLVAKK
jgi:8-oxo-dGTP diphosphatase